MTPRLFVGGPYDGRIIDIEEDAPVWRVIEPIPVAGLELDELPEMAPIHTYYPRRWMCVNHELPYDGSWEPGFITGKGRLVFNERIYYHESEPSPEPLKCPHWSGMNRGMKLHG